MTAADVYRALWRHKTLIAVLTAVCVAATWFLTSREAKTYSASTLVRIQPAFATADALNGLETSQRLAQTYTTIIDSGVLTPRIRASVASKIPAQRVGRMQISASPVQDTELLWISTRGRSPADTATVANAVAVTLRNFVRESGTLRDEVIILKSARPPTAAVSPDMKLNLGLALVLGLIFNSALALLIEILRDRLPEPEELGAALGYPVLATIPTLIRRRTRSALESDQNAVPAPATRLDSDSSLMEEGRPQVRGGR